jgi:hypothetical protein
MDVTIARSRGGKDGLAATSGVVLEGEPACGPALSPKPDGVGVEAEASSGLHVGKRGEFVEQQDQVGALPKVGRSGTRAGAASGLGEESLGEGRAMLWQRPRHETAPGATGQLISGDDTGIIGPTQRSVTLQLFVKRTTKPADTVASYL